MSSSKEKQLSIMDHLDPKIQERLMELGINNAGDLIEVLDSTAKWVTDICTTEHDLTPDSPRFIGDDSIHAKIAGIIPFLVQGLEHEKDK